jgi:prepilin-type N-terminal cleavage/methylation domain-containing protein
MKQPCIQTHLKIKSGFTLVEILIAMVIFSMVIVGLLQAITTADKIHGRGTWVRSASQLAQNEAELIKNIAQSGEELNDTSYTATINKRECTVIRKRNIPFDMFPSEINSKDTLTEVDISIADVNQTSRTLHFKLLQGPAY